MLSLTEHSKMTVSYLTIKRHNKQEKFNVMLPARFRFFSFASKEQFSNEFASKEQFSNNLLGIFGNLFRPELNSKTEVLIVGRGRETAAQARNHHHQRD